MLLDAQKGGYAVGAFNTENMEGIQAVIEAAEELGAPVIIQTTSSMIKYCDPFLYNGMVRALAERASVPVALHLDHGNSYETAALCLRAGYTSVMIDGSKLDFAGNIAVTRRVVEMCAPCGIPVEAELGKVGGKEDETACDDPGYTDPKDAVTFVEKTGISSLAVAIGTAHGFYKGTPVLDKNRLAEIRSVVAIPLVLHGASGLSDEDVKDCVKLGICKVNFATELRKAYTDGVREVLTDETVYDPKAFGKVARARVKAQTMARMQVCGCAGRAR